ncbi:hypothetical protein HELRODRAFT_155706 [Helobdella robusta]|uniref:C-CAP/cofactor C-like domain-containing protein n=1 Tax=Helobdella robusta TaxID=6412 RepID=T1ELL1_HELRO|nr:hypothetical protein HELRODRAFT_155706 [Helobdella robusta]ESO06448.1 hypothetical protein HELRODRAFT_155706 [Helobdella robusta]
MATQKSRITEKLQKREEERIKNQQAKRNDKPVFHFAEETEEHFKKKFTDLQNELELLLAGVRKIEAAYVSSKLEGVEEAQEKLNTMQVFYTNSSGFISSFARKSAQSVITNLTKSIEEIKDSCYVNKKFSFKTNNNAKDIVNLDNVEIAKQNDEILNKDIRISNLTNCTVKLYGHPGAIHIDRIKNCKIFIGPVKGSILIEDCSDSKIIAACQQMRIHKTVQSHFYIHVTSRAIIEDSNNVKFAPFNWNYEGVKDHFNETGLDLEKNNWDLVEDFNWLVPNTLSPNWSILQKEDRMNWE